MKRSLLFFLLVFGVACLVFAKQVDQNSARIVAQNYFANMNLDMEGSDLQLVYTCTVSSTDDFKLKNSLYYVFNKGNENGFIIISGDDRAAPVLGYTLKGNFDESELPPNVKKWFEGYKKAIWYAIDNKVDPPAAVAENWESLLNGTDNTRSVTAVGPLMSTIWNQSPYYNDLCPGGSVSGCVATAMAQVMKYWDHPAQGAGFHSYDHQTYGTLSANFGGTSYEWASMPNDVQSSNNAVATLMYHCGVSVDMNYSPQVSGAYVITDQSPVQHCSEYAFRNYFGYDNSMQGLQRSNYSTSQWVQMLKDDLDAGRPILYAGFGSGGGHAFVCDGYDANSFFHFNWGWGGYYDGFFSIDALDPGGTGTGGGTGGYNSGHQAILNLKPASGGGGGSDFNLALYEGLSFSANPLSYGQPFSVHSNIINNGNGDYSGDYCAAVLDNSLAFIDFVEVKTGYTLTGGGYYYTDGLDFESTGLFTMLPGSYYIGIYYRPDWRRLDTGR